MLFTLAATALPISLAGWYLGPMGLRHLAERKLRSHCAATRSLVLTYDDGPSPGITTRLLTLLESHQARATFFMVGLRASLLPELADLVAAGGHEIGVHTHTHCNAWYVAPWRSYQDVQKGFEAMHRWCAPPGIQASNGGRRTGLKTGDAGGISGRTSGGTSGGGGRFRPPFGKMTALTWAQVRLRGAPISTWTLDSGDTFESLPTPESVVEKAKRTGGGGGGVVLMHDRHRDPRRADFTLRTTELLLEAAKTEGWQVRTLAELSAALQGEKGQKVKRSKGQEVESDLGC